MLELLSAGKFLLKCQNLDDSCVVVLVRKAAQAVTLRISILEVAGSIIMTVFSSLQPNATIVPRNRPRHFFLQKPPFKLTYHLNNHTGLHDIF
jgi:hypothetical protein